MAGRKASLCLQAYQLEEYHNVLEVAGRIEAEHYMHWTRLEEIMGYCRQMEYKRLGIAMCVGLSREAEILAVMFQADFFTQLLQINLLSGEFYKAFSLILDEGGHW